MITRRTVLRVTDNSGVRRVRCIRPVGRRVAGVGQLVRASVRKARPQSTWKAGRVVRVLVVRTKGRWRTGDGQRLRFHENAGVLVGADGGPRATRITGGVPRRRRQRGYGKVVTRADSAV